MKWTPAFGDAVHDQCKNCDRKACCVLIRTGVHPHPSTHTHLPMVRWMYVGIYERELLKEYEMDDVGTYECQSYKDCKTAYCKRAMSPVLYRNIPRVITVYE